jgi:MYXO-CTERM domain-containing protein
MQAVKDATGTTPLLYTSPAFLSNFGGLGAYPLWVANYGVSCPDVPAAWKTYTFWQSSGSGSFPPITGAVDLDTFNGTHAELTAFANGTSASDSGTSDAASDAAPNDAPAVTDTSDDASTGGELQETGGCSVASSNADLGWLAALVIAAEASRRRRRAAPVTAR